MCRRWWPRRSRARASSPTRPAACTPTSTCMHGGATEATPTTPPPGAYANSCVAREQMFQYFSRTRGTPGRIIRLNYAIDMRYGVLHDVALAREGGRDDRPRRSGHVNVVWQGDANAMVLRALGHCTTPSTPLNVSGPETISIRWLARGVRRSASARRRRSPARKRRPRGWSTQPQAMRLFGYPRVPLARLIDWTADWIARGLPSLGKPTGFRQARWRFLIRAAIGRARAARELAGRRERWSPRPAGTRSPPTGGSSSSSAPSMRCATAPARDRNRRDAAVWRTLRLDQHGAGRGRASPPRPCDAAAAPLHRGPHGRGAHSGARRHAGRRDGLRAARISGSVGLRASRRPRASQQSSRRRARRHRDPADRRRRLAGAVRLRRRRVRRRPQQHSRAACAAACRPPTCLRCATGASPVSCSGATAARLRISAR